MFRLESSDFGEPQMMFWPGWRKFFKCTAVMHFLLFALELGLVCEEIP